MAADTDGRAARLWNASQLELNRPAGILLTMIKDLAFAVYYVRDVPGARRFYTEVLGLKPGEWFNDEWIEFDLGNATFALDATGEALGIAPGTSRGVSFEVDDIHAMRQRVVDAGSEVSEKRRPR